MSPVGSNPTLSAETFFRRLNLPSTMSMVVLGGEPAVPCTRNPL